MKRNQFVPMSVLGQRINSTWVEETQSFIDKNRDSISGSGDLVWGHSQVDGAIHSSWCSRHFLNQMASFKLQANNFGELAGETSVQINNMAKAFSNMASTSVDLVANLVANP